MDEIKNAHTSDGESTAANESVKDNKDKKQKTDKKTKAELDAARAALAEEMKKTDELTKKLEDAENRYLHMLAEYDNFRRRTAKERDDIEFSAVCETVKQILPIIDNLERATIYTDAEKVAEGLALISKSAEAMLTKLGITTIGEVGEPFDPNRHNAVMHTEDESLGENEIADVLQRGYAMGEHIIRYAMVKVAN